MQPEGTPSFDTWTSLFLLGAALGFFLVAVLLSNRRIRRDHTPIVLLVLGFSLIIVEYVFYWTGYSQTYSHLYFFSHSWYLLFGPLVYGYVVRFYDRSLHISWYHYIPVALSFVLNAIYYVRSNGYSNLQALGEEGLFYFFLSMRTPWLAVFSLFFYLFITADYVRFQRPATLGHYTRLRARWTRLLLGLFFLFSLAFISYYILVRFPFFSPEWDYAISFTMAIAIYTIGYMVYREPAIFNGEMLSSLFLTNENDSEEIQQGGQFSEETLEELYAMVLGYMETEAPYRDNNLRLVQLADALSMGTHTLSKVVNEKSNKNFNQFVNEFRLREAERLLTAENDASIKSIYYEVGFNTKATFYKAFKQKHHCTPTEYKKRLKTVQHS
jgi:AraC-like DNA-binding protein